jgi:hypothetical protein
MMINEFLAAQVVQHPTEDKWYYVSTINRESGIYPGDTFSETIVFGWDKEKQKREGILYQASHCTDSLWEHNRIIKRIEEVGMVGFEGGE